MGRFARDSLISRSNRTPFEVEENQSPGVEEGPDQWAPLVSDEERETGRGGLLRLNGPASAQQAYASGRGSCEREDGLAWFQPEKGEKRVFFFLFYFF